MMAPSGDRFQDPATPAGDRFQDPATPAGDRFQDPATPADDRGVEDPATPADDRGVDTPEVSDPAAAGALPPVAELPPEAEAQLQALIAEQNARRAVEAAERKARRDLWLTHHWSDEYERCAAVRGRHVCRRCLTLYPIAIAVMVASLLGLPPWPERLDVWLIWLLCIPATLEFLAEKLRDVAYSPRRQVVVTALVAVALGRGLSHEVDDRWSWLFWGPVLVFGAIWFAAAMANVQRAMFRRALEASQASGDFASSGEQDDPGD